MVNLDASTVTVLVPVSVSILLLLGHLLGHLHRVGLVMLLILLLLREFVAWNALLG